MSVPITVSLRSRGLVVSHPQHDQGLTGHARAFASDFANIGVCILYNVVLLPLIAWFTVIVSLLSTVFAYTYQDGILRPDPSIAQLFCFLVYLPVLWLVVNGYQRRNSAQQALNKYKAAVTGLNTVHLSYSSSAEGRWSTLPQDMMAMTDDLVTYLQAPRPGTRSYHLAALSSNPTGTPGLLGLSQEIGILTRRLQWHHKQSAALLSSAPPEQASWVASLHHQLGEALDAAGALKEQRSPLLLRAAMTSYVGVVLPVFFGPYVASSARNGLGNSSTLVWGIVVAALLQVMVMTLWHLGVLLEDPFDPAVTDGVSCGELAAQLAWVLSCEEAECPPLPGGIAVAPSAVPTVGPVGGSGVTALVHPASGSHSSAPAAGASKGAGAGQRQSQPQVYVAQAEQQAAPLAMQQVTIGMPPMPHLG